MRRKTLVSALFVLLIVSMIPVGAQMTPTIDGVISSGEWGEVDYTGTGYKGYEGYKVYVQNDLDYLYVAFVDHPGADYAIAGGTSICVYPGDDYAGECWVYEPWGPGYSPDLIYYTTHHIQPPIVIDGKQDLSTTSVVGVGLNVMEWKIPLDEFSAKPGDTIAFDLYSYMEGFSDEETAWIYKVYYTLWAPNTLDLTATVLAPPVADAGGPYYCDRYETILLDGSSSYDPDGSIVSYEWDFGDGTTGTGVKPSHTYSSTGKFTVMLTVTDDDDLTDSDSTTVTVSKPSPPPSRRPNKKPKADAGLNVKISVGSTIYFSGADSYDKDGKIITYRWDFGDGTMALGKYVSHIYSEPGHYTVTLTVKDDRGAEDSDKCHVKVWDPLKAVVNRFGESVPGGKKGHIVDAMEEANAIVTLDTTDYVTVTILRYEENPHPNDPMPANALPTYVDVEVSNSTAVEWPIYVEAHYTDKEVEGLDESSLGIYYWMDEAWHRCSHTGVDTERNVVWAYMTEEEASGSPILIGSTPPLIIPPLPPILSDLTITPPEIELGDEVTISLVITSIDSQSLTYIVTMRIGELTLLVDVELDAYEAETVSRTITPDAVGDYNVTVDGMTGSFTAKSPPTPLKPAEFIISGLTVLPTEVSEGEEVTISVTITNIGETTGTHTLEIMIDGDKPEGPPIETVLEGGASTTATIKVFEDPGDHTVKIDRFTDVFTVTTPQGFVLSPGYVAGILILIIIAGTSIYVLSRGGRLHPPKSTLGPENLGD